MSCEFERREFLKATGAAVAAAWTLPGLRMVFAQDGAPARAAAGRRTLVAIYLRGGQDAMNVVVPHGEKRYYEMRPTIAIPPEDTDEGPGVVKLDGTFGLHPALKSLKPLWDAKRLAIVINAGSPHGTRSHFDAQDFMEYAAPGMRTVKSGWLNRYLEATRGRAAAGAGLRALAAQPLLPRALRGEHPVLAVPERSVLNNDKVLDKFEEIYGKEEGGMGGRRDDPVVGVGRETLRTLERYRELVEKRRKERPVAYPSTGLGQRLQDVASVIHADAGLEVAAVDVGGWDHHTNELPALQRLLRELADSMAAFAADLGEERMARTLVLTMTEFGRTCRENGNAGTDHGHGGCMFLLGATVQGGRIHGDWRGLEDKGLYQARDLPAAVDFRDVFAEVLRSHLDFEAPRGFFPEYAPQGVPGLF